MATKKNDKKPIVNWFSRKKEVSYGDSTSADGKKVKIKTKVVTAPDSKMSKGFEKKKVTAEVKRDNPKMGTIIGGMIGGGSLGASATQSYEKKRAEKSLQNLKTNPGARTQKQIDKLESETKSDIASKAKSAKNLLVSSVAGPLVGMAVDKARGKTKQVTVSKTKTKKK